VPLDPANAIRSVKKYYPSGSYGVTYFFFCSECGDEIKSQSGQTQNHSGLCRSCTQKGRPFQSAYTQLLGNQHKNRVAVFMTYEQFYPFCLEKYCHYCSTYIKRSSKKGEKGYRGYFLDRKDNDKPYTVENCVSCCWECNQAKGNRYSYDEFMVMQKARRKFNEKRLGNISKFFSQEQQLSFELIYEQAI
jgi:hypothetical protein